MNRKFTCLSVMLMICILAVLPAAALTAVDIGSPNTPGTTVETMTDITMTTDGPSFWNSSDIGHFAYETLDGDGSVTVRFASYTNGQTYSKCGIMFRESLDANAKNAFICVRPAATLFQRRTATGGGTVKTEAYGQTPPKWIRLTRSGDDFSAYYSDDGTNWTQLGTAETITMGSTIYIGLAASSGDANEVVTAVFDNITGLTPPNTPPTADAGSDQTVTDADDSGSESVTLDGSGSSDSDGTITTYSWEENSSQIATGVNPSVSLSQGVHNITLIVTDDGSETDSDTVVITVNDPPTADAGSDQTVTDADSSGSESVTLNGSGSSDADGSIASYSWEENSSQIATGVSPAVSLTTGSHTINLTVTDNDGGTDSDTVVINVNIPPVANAGNDQTVNDADDSGSEQITLDASGSSDSDGSITSYVWKENSSPIASGVSPSVSFAVGVHTVTLEVTDDDGALDSDTVVIDITEYVNIPPVADAGNDQTVNDADDSGDEQITLDGSSSADSDGTIASYVWKESSTQIATGVNPIVTLSVGSHTITLEATDDDGAMDSDTVVIDVTAYVNIAPVADAGPDQTVTDSDDSGSESVTLDGSGSSDSDGSIATYVWEENSTQIATGVSPAVSLAVGTHTIDLTVTDDDGATDSDTVVVTVDPAPSAGAPVVFDFTQNGTDLEITAQRSDLSEQFWTLVIDENRGVIKTFYDLTSVAGTNFNFASPYGSGAGLFSPYDTDIRNADYTYTAGAKVDGQSSYTFTLYEDDGTAQRTITVTINVPDENGTLITAQTSSYYANAASSAQIATPAMWLNAASETEMNAIYTTTLQSDLSIDGTLWVDVEVANSPEAAALNLPVGRNFRLTALDYTDGQLDYDDAWGLTWHSSFRAQGGIEGGIYDGWASKPPADTTVVTNCQLSIDIIALVQTNELPVANAGSDQTVVDDDDNGSETVTLDGSASSDSDGAIESYVWEENSSQIATGENPQVSLSVGTHNIDLTVTDDLGGTDTDTVVITVDPHINVAPTADAGSDQTVADSDDGGDEVVTLDASGSSDSDGTISTYVWEENSSQIATGVNPNVTLAVGTHTIDLTVTDDDGATDTDTVVITVNAAPPAASVVLNFTQNGTDLEITAERSDQSEQFWTLVIDENHGVVKTFYDLTSVAGTSFNYASPYGSGAGLFTPYDTDIRNGDYTYTAGAKVDGQTNYTYTLYEDDGVAQKTTTVTINVPDENSTLITGQTSAYYPNAAASAQKAEPEIWLNAATESEMNAIYSVTTQADISIDGTLWVDIQVTNSPETSALNLTPGRTFRLTALDYTDGQLDYDDAWGLTWHSSFRGMAGVVGGIVDNYASKPGADSTVVTNCQLEIDITAVSGPANVAPVANAGNDQTVTDTDDSGDESVALDGSASSDSDGTIASYVWEENSSQIASGVNPNVTLAVGTHTIDLTVTDDGGATDTDTVVITVDPYVNVAPTANAGNDQTVTDTDDGGDEVVTLDGSGSSDSDGTITSYVWEENSSQIASGVSPNVTLAVGTHTIDLTVTDDDGATDTDTVVVTVDPATPVNPLTGVDIGSPSISGSLSVDNDVYTVTGGGSALWGSSDSFYFAYTQITGDATITVRQASIGNIQTYTKTGIMFRESLDTNAMNVLAGTRGSGYATFQRRTATGGSTVDTRVSGSAPIWIQLVRSGNDFSAYHSSDGTNWTQIGTTETIAMSSTVYVGLAMSAGNDTEAVSGVYDNVDGLGSGGPTNVAPVADAGSDQTVTDTDESGSEMVTLDGTGSTDSDGSIVSYVWEENSSQIGTGDMPVVDLAVGSHTITLTVTDDDGATDTDTVDVTVNSPTGPQPPTVQTISEYKSGISLSVLGTYGTDYLVEQWYHDPKIDPRCTIYINSDVDIDLFHNAKNMNTLGEDVDDYVVIGVDGLDGIPDSGDEGIIRYRVDQEMTTRAKWAENATLYPAWSGTASFDDFEYDPGDTVVGVTGPLPGGDISDPTTFYWRGMVDSVGDEWHVIAVGDDDTAMQSYYANRSSDGKIYYFVVNPTTPSMNIITNDSSAQFYVTPPKTYFVPVIRDQTAYVIGDCDIELAALGGSQVEYSLVVEGQSANWQSYSVPINTVTANLQSDTRYELKYRIGSSGPVKTRIVHYDPAFPSDTEVHPKNILWENGETGIQRIRDRLDREPYASNYDDYLNSSFAHQRDGTYAATLYTGDRWCGIRMQLLASAFPLLIDGFDQHPECSAFLKNAMLDTFMNLDPVGMEHVWAQNSPSREINKQGYYGVTRPLANALAYDWVIKDLRAGSHQHGFTAVEDYKLRDNLATFANWTMYTHTKQLNIDANGFNVGMWSGAWTHGAAIIAAVMEDYDSDLYGTSGAPGGTYNAPRPWTPFPDYPLTWWDVCNNKNLTIQGTPNLNMKSTFWGLLNENEEWYDRRGYWGGSMMGWLYYTTMNFRANFDGYHYAHLDSAVKKIAEGGQIMPGKSPQEGPLEFYTALMVNHHFPAIAPVELDKLDDGTNIYEKNIDFSLFVRGVLGVCLYEDDWDQ